MAPDRRRSRASAAGPCRTAPPAMSDGPPHGRDRRCGSQDSISTAGLSSRHRPPKGELSNRNQAKKKPGRNKGSAGIPSPPGLFSELFNVAASRPAQMTTEWSETSPWRAFRQGKLMVNRTGDDLVGGRRPCPVANHERQRALILRDAAAAWDEEKLSPDPSDVKAPRSALARSAAKGDRYDRRRGASPADGARRHHRPADPGQADPGSRFGVSAGARGRHDAAAGR